MRRPPIPILPCIFYPLDPAQLLDLICANTTSSACSRIFPASHLSLPSSATLLYPVRSPIHRRIPRSCTTGDIDEQENRNTSRLQQNSAIWSAGGPSAYLYLPPGSHQWDDLQWVRPGASISSLLGWHRSPCALGFLGHSYWSCLFLHFPVSYCSLAPFLYFTGVRDMSVLCLLTFYAFSRFGMSFLNVFSLLHLLTCTISMRRFPFGVLPHSVSISRPRHHRQPRSHPRLVH
ncbi:hypothetical protein C8Q73DRAFT_308149 [Cubamyces lactineus]|nr:hypothetical protein C8Q73DRAFT_308149 [Cubamyces lactineus]